MTPDLSSVVEGFFRDKRLYGLNFSCSYSGKRFPMILLSEQAQRSNLETVSDLHRRGIPVPEGLVCVAYTGKGFLGRHDRTWQCEPGNLHAVFHLKPMITPAAAGPAFSILAAVACVETVDKLYPHAGAPTLKWVNDLFVGKKKIAGVLTRQTFLEPLITNAFLGIGVNVQVEPRLMPDPFVPDTGCLRKLYDDPTLAPGHFLIALMEQMETWYDRLLTEGVGTLLNYYRAHSEVLNRQVRIYEDGYGLSRIKISDRKIKAEGEVEAILDDLSLKIRDLDLPVSSGRLALVEDCL
ncbi:MAG: biotin--[acetyl-CoA-carboxylase] ligase [Planctomycetota bacterium]